MRITHVASLAVLSLALTACGDNGKTTTTDGGPPGKDNTPAKDGTTPAKDGATPAKDGTSAKDSSATPAASTVPKGQEAAVTIARMKGFIAAVMEHDIEAGAEPTGKSGDPAVSSNEQALVELRKLPTCKAVLEGLGKEAFADVDKDGRDEILDGWGRPMMYAPRVSHSDDNTKDDVLPEFKNPFIASAGADGAFGDAKGKPQGTEGEDNIYSYATDAALKKYGPKSSDKTQGAAPDKGGVPAAYFYDVSRGELFVDRGDQIPPITRANGEKAFKAYIFTCGSCANEKERFVGFYEGFTQEYKDKLQKATEDAKAGGDKVNPAALLLDEGTFKARLISIDGKSWVTSDSQEGIEINLALSRACEKKSDGRLRPCYPDMK